MSAPATTDQPAPPPTIGQRLRAFMTRPIGSVSKLRPSRRDGRTLASIADSLAVIASGIQLICKREYQIDPAVPLAPAPRELWEPVYSDNEAEALREEAERFEREERDTLRELERRRSAIGPQDGPQDGDPQYSQPPASAPAPAISMSVSSLHADGSASDGTDSLTAEERDFLERELPDLISRQQ